MPPDALDRLTGPGFTETTFGRRPLHVAGADPGGFADLLSLRDVDHIVASTALRAPAFRLVRDGATLPRSSVTRQARIGSRPVDDLVDVAAVHREFAAGASIVLQGLHRSFPPVAAFCRSLEAALTHPVQANAYLTPPVAQGLDLHEDPHDVFAVQTHGTKRWVVHPAGEAPWDLRLHPGDVLYLPAGTRHAAQTTDAPSLHLTLGVRTLTWRDAVRAAIDRLLDDADGWLDAPLPAGWADDHEALTATLDKHLRERLSAEVTDHARGALRQLAEGFWQGRPPDLAGGLLDVLELDRLVGTTGLKVRDDAVCRLRETDDRLEILLADRRLTTPVGLTPALQRMLERRRFAPQDLDGLLDQSSRLVLCRRLVREGLLTFDRGKPDG